MKPWIALFLGLLLFYILGTGKVLKVWTAITSAP